MMCPYPILVKNKFGTISRVGCGQCMACRLNKSREWSIRIMNETLYHEDSCFLTLTYDDEHLPKNQSLVKKDLSKFLNKQLPYELGRHCRYYASGEYGDLFGRPHYHVIIFGLSPSDDIFKNKRYDRKHKGWHCTLDCWPCGLAFVAPVTYDDACYVASYTMKKLNGKKADYYEEKGIQPEFAIMSLKPGIGAQYMRDNKGKLRRRGYIIGKNGQKVSVPRYYKDKCFSPFYREYWKNQRVKEIDAEIKEKAESVDKEVWRYREEILENAMNIMNSLMENRKRK